MLRCIFPNSETWWWWLDASAPHPPQPAPKSSPTTTTTDGAVTLALARAVRATAMMQCGDYGTCPVCMNEWCCEPTEPTDVVFITCQAHDGRSRAGEGPVHAVCSTCWSALQPSNRCPMCLREGVRGLGAEAYARWCLSSISTSSCQVTEGDTRESVDEVNDDEVIDEGASTLERTPASMLEHA